MASVKLVRRWGSHEPGQTVEVDDTMAAWLVGTHHAEAPDRPGTARAGVVAPGTDGPDLRMGGDLSRPGVPQTRKASRYNGETGDAGENYRPGRRRAAPGGQRQPRRRGQPGPRAQGQPGRRPAGFREDAAPGAAGAAARARQAAAGRVGEGRRRRRWHGFRAVGSGVCRAEVGAQGREVAAKSGSHAGTSDWVASCLRAPAEPARTRCPVGTPARRSAGRRLRRNCPGRRSPAMPRSH
jgi:hypothetical protein